MDDSRFWITTVDANGVDPSGVTWDLTPGAIVAGRPWELVGSREDGLLGLRGGRGDWSELDWDADALAVLFSPRGKPCCDFGVYAKCFQARVVEIGTLADLLPKAFGDGVPYWSYKGNDRFISRDDRVNIFAPNRHSRVASCGMDSIIVLVGGQSFVASSGDWASISCHGSDARVSTSGCGDNISIMGAYSSVTTKGDGVSVQALERSPYIDCRGVNSTITAMEFGARVRLGPGGMASLAYRLCSREEQEFVTLKSGVAGINPDRWYMIGDDGSVVSIKDPTN